MSKRDPRLYCEDILESGSAISKCCQELRVNRQEKNEGMAYSVQRACPADGTFPMPPRQLKNPAAPRETDKVTARAYFTGACPVKPSFAFVSPG